MRETVLDGVFPSNTELQAISTAPRSESNHVTIDTVNRRRRTLLLNSVSRYIPVAIDASAAGLSLAASRLSSPRPVQITAGLSGALWSIAAGTREVGNSPRSYAASAANFLGGSAGVLSTTAAFVSGENLKGTAYASAGAWAMNGAASVIRAFQKSDSKIAQGILMGASGAANMAAAGLSAAAVHASTNNDSARAAKLATASSAMWVLGSTAEAAAVWAGADYNPSKLADIEQTSGTAVLSEPPPVLGTPGQRIQHQQSFVGTEVQQANQHEQGLHHMHTHYKAEPISGHAVVLGSSNNRDVEQAPSGRQSGDESRQTQHEHGLHHLRSHYEADHTTGHALESDPSNSTTKPDSAHLATEVSPTYPERARTNRDKYDERRRDQTIVDR